MSSPINIKLQCEPFLIQFLVSTYGPMPVVFPKGDRFASMLQHFLDRPPKDYVPSDFEIDANTLLIQLPYFENKNVLYNFYLSDLSKTIMIKSLYIFFKVQFRTDVDRSRYLGLSIKESIQLFMDKYDLSPDYTDMLEKDYHRICHSRRNKKYRKKKSKK